MFGWTRSDEANVPELAECVVEPAAEGPEEGPLDAAPLPDHGYVEYVLSGARAWTGYRATVDLAAGASGSFVSIDFRDAAGALVEVRVGALTDARGARWLAARAVGSGPDELALLPLADDRVDLAIAFAPSSARFTLRADGQTASVVLPPTAVAEVLRIGQLGVDGPDAPLAAVEDARLMVRAR